ncbi:carbon monoxide dehydrogenase subunit G [Rhizobium sp. BK275]|uniref:head GIN domain-containing protein n=1 Tax=Rhizobium sp. BK275 TaxID=2587077 RepID=UPI00161D1DAA|nr:head GIN domain-containing protein [Rhizobium sp. BK275]MBB3392907.1 carbon monoxide dehydrogenase subunit G [Rhizobium sp. BK275]
MARKLAFFATTGLIGAAAFLALGVALSGPGWTDALHAWSGKASCVASASDRQQVTLPFTASDSLVINLPAASVHYQPGDKAQAVISGNPALLEHVRVEGDELSLDCEPGWFASPLDVKLSGPAITKWELLGNGDLTLSQIDQPRLQLSIEGSGNSSASGTADAVDLTISGSGSARMQDLTAKSVQVNIYGSGDARMTAQADADVSISGSGNVELFGNPVLRRSEIRGSGRIQQMP